MNKRGEHIALFVQRYKLLREIGQLQVEAEADESAYLARCCAILLRDPECCLAWVGRQEKDRTITPLHIAVKDPAAAQQCQLLVHQLALEPEGVSPAARALATDPRFLILDEPAGGMNDQETEDLMGLIRAIRSRGITVLLIEHDMNLVMRVCDRLVVLEYGAVIAEGTPDEIKRNPHVIEAYLGTDEE